MGAQATHPNPEVTVSSTNHTARDGLIVGLIGFVSVAVFYAVFDVLAARGSLYTVDLLGKSVFRGLRDTSVLGLPMQLDMTAIALYSGLHLVLSLVIGQIVTGVVGFAERQPARAALALLVIIAGFVVTIFAVGVLTVPIRPLLPWWSIVVANMFAVLFAGAYLIRKRPGTWSRLVLSREPRG